jgi:ubiquinone biosynthesis accessory factor UbiJ
MIGFPAAAFINHLLAREQWARDRLTPFSGRRVRFRAAPLPDLVMEIDARGHVATCAADDVAVTLTIPTATLPRILARDEGALRDVRLDGDAGLANAILFLFRNLRWDVEEDLSRVVGDVAAHRMAGAAHEFAAWQRLAAERLGQNVAEYLKDEAELLMHPHELEAFGRQVDEMRDAVERLEKRVERLIATEATRAAGSKD